MHRLRRIVPFLLAPLAAAALAQVPAPTAAAGDPKRASDWPQVTTVDGTTFEMNEPSYTAISGNTVTLQSEVKVQAQGGKPVIGTVTLTSSMAPADVGGLVELNNLSVTGTGGITDANVSTALTKQLAGLAITVPLATLVQDIAVDASRDETQLSNAPPRIVISGVPAVLVSVAGQPVLAAVGSGGWKKVTNTPCIVLQSSDGSWWVRLGASQWMTSSAIDGAYKPSQTVPPADVIAALGSAPAMPQGVSDDIQRVGASLQMPPFVMVSTTPAVLVSLDGPMTTRPVAPGLRMVTNTRQVMLESDQSPKWWVLGSGRWFASDSMQGPWKYVAPSSLPASFAKIDPESSGLGAALASVPGTTAAKEASVNNALVRTVVLDRSKATCDVSWRGKPAFASVTGTSMRYGTNASQPVIELGGAFYCCDSAAWFRSDSAGGPWTICDNVPADLYTIPPSCPVYPATFVEVYGSTPDSVTFGFTNGYLGSYMQDGAAVFGTGYDYTTTVNDDGSTNTYPQTYSNQTNYDQDSGTWAPPYGDAYADSYPALYPGVYAGGWGGWGWYGGYTTGWGWGWGHWGWNHNWNHWFNNWHPNDSRWNNALHDWGRDDAARRNLANRTFHNGGDRVTAPRDGRPQWTSMQQRRQDQARADLAFGNNVGRTPPRNDVGRHATGFHPQTQGVRRPGGSGYHPTSAYHGGGARGGGGRR